MNHRPRRGFLEALALGNADLAAALTAAQNAFTAHFPEDITYETAAGSYCHIVDVGGVDTWRSVNPDWGQAAVNYANAVTVTFTNGPGDCTCEVPITIPTLSEWGLGIVAALLAAAGVVVIRRRLRTTAA